MFIIIFKYLKVQSCSHVYYHLQTYLKVQSCSHVYYHLLNMDSFNNILYCIKSLCVKNDLVLVLVWRSWFKLHGHCCINAKWLSFQQPVTALLQIKFIKAQSFKTHSKYWPQWRKNTSLDIPGTKKDRIMIETTNFCIQVNVIQFITLYIVQYALEYT